MQCLKQGSMIISGLYAKKKKIFVEIIAKLAFWFVSHNND